MPFSDQVVLNADSEILVSEFALLLLTAWHYLILPVQTIKRNNLGHSDFDNSSCGFNEENCRSDPAYSVGQAKVGLQVGSK